MSLTQGVNFRATAGFVTDPLNYDHELGFASVLDYPTVLSPSGVNGGWESGTIQDSARDRSAAADARLAGFNFISVGSGNAEYRLDLPATGTYSVGLGVGDPNSAQGPMTVDFRDTTTVLFTPVNNVATSGADNYYDATGVQRTSSADWTANNAAKSLTFATTIFRIRITAGNTPLINNFFIQSATGDVLMAQSCF